MGTIDNQNMLGFEEGFWGEKFAGLNDVEHDIIGAKWI